MDLVLSLDEKRALCAIARESIEARLFHRAQAMPASGKGFRRRAGAAGSTGSAVSAGAFVTLHENGQLRGCIGRMRSELPLDETISEMAQAAAFEDPRFDPVSRAEIADITIEITVLGILRKIASAEEIVVGNHGIYIIARGRSGVLLPQVATEYGWNRLEFLDHVCLKAGLPPRAWQDADTQLFIFEGIVFGESDPEISGFSG